MAVPGIFNVMNAVSALACAHILGADMKNAAVDDMEKLLGGD